MMMFAVNAIARLPAEIAALFESLEESPDGVFVTDRHNRVVFWNNAVERVLGYETLQAVGMHCDRLLKGCDVFENRYCSEECPVMRLATRGEPVKSFRMRVAAKDGRQVNLDFTILQLSAPPPDGYYLAHILHEIEGDGLPLPRPAGPLPPQIPDVRDVTDVRARRLTAREVEVLAMIAAGRTTPEIAERLHISALTARNHVQNILDKLEVHSKAEAVAFAFQKRLV